MANKDIVYCHFCRAKPSKYPNTIGKVTVGACADCRRTDTHDFCDPKNCNYVAYYGMDE